MYLIITWLKFSTLHLLNMITKLELTDTDLGHQKFIVQIGAYLYF